MKPLVVFGSVLLLAGCGSQDRTSNDASGSPIPDEPATYPAPYGAVYDSEAPTVESLQESDYANVDHYPVGCDIPDEPEAACDATGAVFMDRREFIENPIATHAEEYDRYEYVCPAINGEDIQNWKCRAQEGRYQ